jgi:hypothetical protein
MRKPSWLVAPLLLAAMLGGCAVPVPAATDNPVSDLVDLIPWAKSVAGTATAHEIDARIAEITARLPELDISDAKRAEVAGKLQTLQAAIVAEPADTAAHAAQLNEILDELKAAVQ